MRVLIFLSLTVLLAAAPLAATTYSVTELGSLGGSGIWVYDLNNNGQVVGGGYTSGGADHAFIYSGGAMHDLGTLGGSRSVAYGVNSNGQVVG